MKLVLIDLDLGTVNMEELADEIEKVADELLEQFDPQLAWAIRTHFKLKPGDPLPLPQRVSAADRAAVEALYIAATTAPASDAQH